MGRETKRILGDVAIAVGVELTAGYVTTKIIQKVVPIGTDLKSKLVITIGSLILAHTVSSLCIDRLVRDVHEIEGAVKEIKQIKKELENG